MTYKVLVIHASTGGGHSTVAKALGQEFGLAKGDWDCTVVDALDYAPTASQWYYREAYHLMRKYTPWVWGDLFALTDAQYTTPALRVPGLLTNAWLHHGLVDYVVGQRPDLIICTHCLPLQVIWMAKKLGLVSVPIHCIITDHYAHDLWLLAGVEQYYVGSHAMARHLDRWSKGKAKTQVTGIPVAPAFRQVRRTLELMKKYGLRDDLPIVLLFGGELGAGAIADAYGSICKADPRCQVIIVTESDYLSERRMRSIAESTDIPTKFFNSVDFIHELMACADIAITAPEGATMAECLASGLIMLMVDPVPGQEDRNLDYVIECGAGRRLYNSEDAGYAVSQIVANAYTLDRMKRQSASLGRLLAGHEIVTTVRVYLQTYGA